MIDAIITYEDEVVPLLSKPTYNREALYVGDQVSVGGTARFTGDPYTYGYRIFINETTVVEQLNQNTGAVSFTQRFTYDTFAEGENHLIIKFYKVDTAGVAGDLLCTVDKFIGKSVYNYVQYIDGIKSPKRELIAPLSETSKIYLSCEQDDKNRVLSTLSLSLYTDTACTITLNPILHAWSVDSAVMPEDTAFKKDYSLSVGNNILDLTDLLLSAKDIYGFIISSLSGGSIYMMFPQSTQTYYRIFLERPTYTYYNSAVLSWPDVQLKDASLFTKFSLTRNGTEIFSTTDYNVRTYEDTTVQKGQTYIYQLLIYMEIPQEVVWDFIYSVKDMWKTSTDKKIVFETQNIQFEELNPTITLDDRSSLSQTGPNTVIDDQGIHILTAQSGNLFNEYFATAVFDISNRTKIKSILAQANASQELSYVIDDVVFVKNMGEGKMYRFIMRKRTRSIDFA